MTLTTDGEGLQVLERDECLRLLATASVGRVGLTWNALPTVLPVNYAMDDASVVFRTGAGTKLAVAVAGAVVAFEADEIDSWYHEGWSVVITGIAHRITDPEDLDRLRRLPLRPWAAGSREDFVIIRPTLVTGRRLERHLPAQL
jgi:nitroimidazol reductase NimA-like FMN-containing flavoprotein (pyridoxamine 5'-phosphate oxidase superfamily)